MNGMLFVVSDLCVCHLPNVGGSNNSGNPLLVGLVEQY